jgi:hypothetical protein
VLEPSCRVGRPQAHDRRAVVGVEAFGIDEDHEGGVVEHQAGEHARDAARRPGKGGAAAAPRVVPSGAVDVAGQPTEPHRRQAFATRRQARTAVVSFGVGQAGVRVRDTALQRRIGTLGSSEHHVSERAE